jgi:formylglycine-generating enzyme required for sulfatase activity
MTQAAFVTIGNADNSSDPSTGYGVVAYEYKISDHEVTIAEFQASGVGNGNENYWNDGTRAVGDNAPATYVNLYEAMRYCNWLTSGSADNGAYIFSGGVYQLTDRNAAVSTYGTVFALPTENEWYKAAYYTGDSGGPWSLYANGTDVSPTTAQSRYSASAVWSVGTGIQEQNETYDMMGNIFEWVEDDSSGVYRGGSYHSSALGMSSVWRYGDDSRTAQSEDIGFRVVMVPEPSTMLLFSLGGIGAWLLRRNQRKQNKAN